MVRPVFIVELVDGADFLQEEKSTGRVRGWPAPPRGCCRSFPGRKLGRRQGKGKLACCRRLQFPSAEVQFAAALATKEALPFYGILDVTCWARLPRV